MPSDKQRKIAVTSQSLYLANLLILPTLSFAVLMWYFTRHRHRFGLGRLHLYRALQLSFANFLLLGVIPVSYILLSESGSRALMLMLFYFVCMHAGFVMLGIVNLARAMSAKNPLF